MTSASDITIRRKYHTLMYDDFQLSGHNVLINASNVFGVNKQNVLYH